MPQINFTQPPLTGNNSFDQWALELHNLVLGLGPGTKGVLDEDNGILSSNSQDIIKDFHLDVGTGTGQISADDIPDGVTNAIVSLTQETNWDNHLTTTTDPHGSSISQTNLTILKTMNWDSLTISVVATTSIPSNNIFIEISGSGGPVKVTANPQIAVGIKQGQLLLIQGESDTNTVEIINGNGIHLHGGKAILGLKDMMLLHWDVADNEWHEITRNFNTFNVMWVFTSPSGSSGTFHFDGFYVFGSVDNDFNPSVNFGSANNAIGAHFFVVQAVGDTLGVDTIIRITGTTITDAGVRTPSATVDVTVSNTGLANTFYETTEKWIGQINISKLSGPDLLMNYGFARYWDNDNNNFRVIGLDVTWLGGANDANPDLLLRHHSPIGWIYNNGAPPTPPPAIASMASDYVTEKQVVNGTNGSWKRTDLLTTVNSLNNEGIIVEIVTTANKTFELGNFIITIRPD